MRSHVEFKSTAFPAYPDEDSLVNPHVFGKRLAEFLAAQLTAHDFIVRGIHPEDWGWVINLENLNFPLWIGCGNHEDKSDLFLCFIEPSKPFVRRWLTKIETQNTVERLATALNTILLDSGKVSALRWWDDGALC